MTAPPSKSYTHRAIVLGALTGEEFQLTGPLVSEDTKATLEAVRRFGAVVSPSGDLIRINCPELTPAKEAIDARNSGTTIRLMTGIASLLPSTTTLTGDSSLVKRPMGPLVDALVQLGARCDFLGEPGRPPLRVTGPMRGRATSVKGGVSSQFVSSLLIACTQKEDATDIAVEGRLTSRPYVDITLGMLREFGAEVAENHSGFYVPGGQRLGRRSYRVPGDFSSAAFPLVAAAVSGGDVTVKNIDAGSPQGDKAILDILSRFGAEVATADGSVRARGGTLHGADVDVGDTPDLFPILAVLAAVAPGRTVITGGRNLREKESDRIATTTAFLRDMGARIAPTDDGCIVDGGGKLHGASVHTEGDHRILMAAAVAGLVSTSEVRIQDEGSYAVSYPGFLDDMLRLGCRLEVRT
ncbi:MAG: 3-phosphoshikimate 1-carboxyvinyltransferase [Thermoplasmata archaeon]|nr:3-phosphoshikimate 1-carboxyvinyltransferase [Thermoplasmata archaeon]